MKYHVGDVVRVTDRKCGHGFDIGEVLIIEETTSYDFRAHSISCPTCWAWWLSEEEVEDAPEFKNVYVDNLLEEVISQAGYLKNLVERLDDRLAAGKGATDRLIFDNLFKMDEAIFKATEALQEALDIDMV